MKKILVVFLTVLVLAGSAYLVLNSQILVTGGFRDKEIIISQRQARQIADQSLVLFESWKEPFISEVYTFYSLSGGPSAFLFTVNDLYGRAGYLTVSASTRFSPVLDFSIDKENPVIGGLNAKTELITGTNYNSNDVRTEYLFLGGTEYFVRHTIRESSELSENYYALDGVNYSVVHKETLDAKMEYYENHYEPAVESAWKKYKLN